jgi:hypothetical protein
MIFVFASVAHLIWIIVVSSGFTRSSMNLLELFDVVKVPGLMRRQRGGCIIPAKIILQ